jgi:hypothetical protein
VDRGPRPRRSRCLRLGVALVIAGLVVLAAGIGLLVIRPRGARPTNRRPDRSVFAGESFGRPELDPAFIWPGHSQSRDHGAPDRRGSQGGHRPCDGLGQGSTERVTPPLSSLFTWTLVDCTDWVGRDWREFESRSGQPAASAVGQLASRHP